MSSPMPLYPAQMCSLCFDTILLECVLARATRAGIDTRSDNRTRQDGLLVMTDRSTWPTLPSEDPTEERRWYRKYGDEWREYAPDWWMSAQEQQYWNDVANQDPDA